MSVVIGVALYLFTWSSTRERVVREVDRVTVRQSLATLRSNTPLLLLCISSLLFITGSLAESTAQIYYLRDVMHHLALYPVLAALQVVLTFAIAGFIPGIVRRLGKRNAYMVAGGLVVLGGSVAFLAPSTLVALGFAGLAVLLLGVVTVNMLVWALEADTVEFGEWKTGVRSEGITYALFSFTRKAGQALGGAAAAYALAIGGYVASAKQQSAGADLGIRAGAGLLPAVFVLLAVGVIAIYPLTDRRHAEIVEEIDERRSGSEDGAGTGPGTRRDRG